MWMEEDSSSEIPPPPAEAPSPPAGRISSPTSIPVRPSPPPTPPQVEAPAPRTPRPAAPPTPTAPPKGEAPAAEPPRPAAPPAAAAAAPAPAPPAEGAPGDETKRRKHVRFRPEGVVARLEKGGLLSKIGLGGGVQTRVINLSEGGVLLVGKTRHPRGTRLALRIEIPSHKDTIACDAEVRWSYQNARDESEFYTGLAFLGLKPVEEKKIAKMREWFTSPEYKAKASTRRLRAGGNTNLEVTSGPDFEIM